MSPEPQTGESELHSEMNAQGLGQVSRLFRGFVPSAVDWGQREYLCYEAAVRTPRVNNRERGRRRIRVSATSRPRPQFRHDCVSTDPPAPPPQSASGPNQPLPGHRKCQASDGCRDRHPGGATGATLHPVSWGTADRKRGRHASVALAKLTSWRPAEDRDALPFLRQPHWNTSMCNLGIRIDRSQVSAGPHGLDVREVIVR